MPIHEHNVHDLSHRLDCFHLLKRWGSSFPHPRLVFLPVQSNVTRVSSVVRTRSRNFLSLRACIGNPCNVSTRFIFSSGVSCLGTQQAITRDMERSPLSALCTVDFLQPTVSVTWRTVWRRSVFITLLTFLTTLPSFPFGRPQISTEDLLSNHQNTSNATCISWL